MGSLVYVQYNIPPNPVGIIEAATLRRTQYRDLNNFPCCSSGLPFINIDDIPQSSIRLLKASILGGFGI